MFQIGRNIYFDLTTGNVIHDTGEKSGDVFAHTVEQEVQMYNVLAERRRDTFDVIHLEYGQYREDFDICIGKRVDLATKQLQFSYPDPNQPEEVTPYQAPLSDKVTSLEKTVDSIMTDVLPNLFG